MRALIIDDEPHARRYLRELLGGEKELVIAGEAASGVVGDDLIQKL
jgi:YesN/AraC family two-component response regulator